MEPKYPTGRHVLVWCNTEVGTDTADAFRHGDIGRLPWLRHEARHSIETRLHFASYIGMSPFYI